MNYLLFGEWCLIGAKSIVCLGVTAKHILLAVNSVVPHNWKHTLFTKGSAKEIQKKGNRIKMDNSNHYCLLQQSRTIKDCIQVGLSSSRTPIVELLVIDWESTVIRIDIIRSSLE